MLSMLQAGMALNSKPPIVQKDNIETEESIRTRDNWDNQDAQVYSNLMLYISTDIKNLAMKADIEHTGKLLDWPKVQYSDGDVNPKQG